MQKYPTFIKGTSITIEKHANPHYWLFSRNPIECDVSTLSLEEMTVFLLHVISHNMKLRRSEASDMPRACKVFDEILQKVLEEPHRLYTTDGVMCLFNLLVVMRDCCVFLLTPLNLLVEIWSRDLELRKLIQKVKDVQGMLDKSCYHGNVIVVLRAATENLLNTFDERLDIVTQISRGCFKERILYYPKPDYAPSCSHFMKIKDSMFTRSFQIILVLSYRRIVKIFRRANHCLPRSDAFRTVFSNPDVYEFSDDYDDHRLDCKTMADNLKILEGVEDVPCFYDINVEKYVNILNEMVNKFRARSKFLSRQNDPNQYFSRSELEVVFSYLSAFLLDFVLSENQREVGSNYLDTFYEILNSLSLFDVLPLLNIRQVAGVSLLCHKLLSNCESTSYSRVPLIRISAVLSKLSYLLSTTHYLARGFSCFSFSFFSGSERIISTSKGKFLDSLDIITVPGQECWRQILSCRGQFTLDTTCNDEVSCYVCLKEITDMKFYVTSCGHVTCENCTEGILEHSQEK